MSQAEDLLNSLTMSEDEPHIVINADRTLTIPAGLKKIAVQHDHNIETVTIDCPRYWDGIDMSSMEFYINYKRADGELGSYIVRNPIIDSSDDRIVHFDWTISSHVTAVKGKLLFLVCIMDTDSDGIVKVHWNSELSDEMYVAEGLEVSEHIEESYPDVISQLIHMSEEETAERIRIDHEHNLRMSTIEDMIRETKSDITSVDVGHTMRIDMIEELVNKKADNILDGTATGSLNQLFDGEETLDFTTKNPNATSVDASLTGSLTKGATGNYATSLGGKSIAMGKRSLAEGTTTIAKGNYSHAEGDNSVALGNDSHAECYRTLAQGTGSHSEGIDTIAKGSYSHSEGNTTISTGNFSHSEGLKTESKGEASHAEGTNTEAVGANAHAEGHKTIAGAIASELVSTYVDGSTAVEEYTLSDANGFIVGHYFGECIIERNTDRKSFHFNVGKIERISGNTLTITMVNPVTDITNRYKTYIFMGEPYSNSSTDGSGSTPTTNSTEMGSQSHTEGNRTMALGNHAHAEGNKTKALGEMSHSEGYETIASSEYQHVQGKFNIEDTDKKYADIIGNGTSDTNRSNAHTLDWQGNAWYQGDIKIGGNSYDDGINVATETELERLKYYGNKDIVPSPESYFTVNETGETITGLTDTGKTQTEIVIPYRINGVEITTLRSELGETSILDGATDKITKVILPNIITSIDNFAFLNCTSLRSINIPNSVMHISRSAFKTCVRLNSINIPNSVLDIERYAFAECLSLTSMNIPNSVSSISESTFNSCTKLTSVNIPNSVTSIANNAFDNCTNLTIYCEQGSYAETYAQERNIPVVYTDVKAETLDNKQDKVCILEIPDTESSFVCDLSTTYNEEFRIKSTLANGITFIIPNEVHPDDYVTSLSFNTGDTAPQIGYSDTGIINWIGTDCSMTNGKSEFTPSANMHYDIVIYYNGFQFVGLVNGYTPATVANSSQTEATS